MRKYLEIDMLNKTILITISAVAAILAVVGAYYASMPSIEIGVPPKITNYTTHIQNDTIVYYVVVGEIANNLKTAIESVQINTTYYDREENLIDTSATYEEKKIVMEMQAGQKSPFEIKLVVNSFDKTPNGCELVLSYVKTSKEAFAKFIFLNHTSDFDAKGHFVVDGWVQCASGGRASGSRVLCTCYDEKGRVIDVSTAYLPSYMYLDDRASFRIISETQQIKPASYQLQAIASIYETPLIERIELLSIMLAIFFAFVILMKRRGW